MGINKGYAGRIFLIGIGFFTVMVSIATGAVYDFNTSATFTVANSSDLIISNLAKNATYGVSFSGDVIRVIEHLTIYELVNITLPNYTFYYVNVPVNITNYTINQTEKEVLLTNTTTRINQKIIDVDNYTAKVNQKEIKLENASAVITAYEEKKDTLNITTYAIGALMAGNAYFLWENHKREQKREKEEILNRVVPQPPRAQG